MNDFLSALIQGIVEGLTEFLPVSSTAHIEIAQELLGTDRKSEFWKMFAVVIQLGAILGVVVYFFRRIVAFVQSFPSGSQPAATTTPSSNAASSSDSKSQATVDNSQRVTSFPSRPWYRHPVSLVMLSFLVTAIPCLLIDKYIGDWLESLTAIGIALIVGGFAMLWIDWIYANRGHTHSIEEMSVGQAVTVGAAQILAAAFPGTSRSMSTIAAGQLVGLTRQTALEFSFFLSIPVMFAAAGYKLLSHLKDASEPMTSHQWLVLLVGFVTSFVVAIAVIAWFLRWVRHHGFVPFAIYRIIAGIVVLYMAYR